MRGWIVVLGCVACLTQSARAWAQVSTESLSFKEVYAEAHLSGSVGCRDYYVQAVGGIGNQNGGGASSALRGPYGAQAFVSIYDNCTGESVWAEGWSPTGLVVSGTHSATLEILLDVIGWRCVDDDAGNSTCDWGPVDTGLFSMTLTANGDRFVGTDLERFQGHGYLSQTRRTGLQYYADVTASFVLDGVDDLAPVVGVEGFDTYGVIGRGSASSVTVSVTP